MLATVVDTAALAKVVVVSMIAGVGVTVAFAFAILGATRFTEMRQHARTIEAGAFAIMATVALATCLAAVVFGIIVVSSK